jgi:hypothetical protein
MPAVASKTNTRASTRARLSESERRNNSRTASRRLGLTHDSVGRDEVLERGCVVEEERAELRKINARRNFRGTRQPSRGEIQVNI